MRRNIRTKAREAREAREAKVAFAYEMKSKCGLGLSLGQLTE
jgi:hypothetical protein